MLYFIADRLYKRAEMRTHLIVEVPKYQLLKERLLEDYGCLDEATLADTLEGISDLPEMIATVVRSALVDEALQAGLRDRIDEMRERLSRLELRAKKKRELALEAMTEVGLSKLHQPDFTASTRPGAPSLLVIAEEAIPATYWVPQPPKLDRQALLGELKRGAAVAGAQLSNPKPVLTVRTK
jgi:Gp157 protein